MNQLPQSLLQLPSGSATLFLQEARNHQLLVNELNALYDSWAYLPVHTPLVDYSKAYEGLVSDKDLKRVYHMIDRDGEILMLRWDITLFLIKQVRSLLSESQGPLRLCYADSILRHQEAEDISRNEFFQTGVELIGRSGPDGDLEVLLLLAQSLRTLGLAPSYHLGSRGIFDTAFGALDDGEQRAISHAIQFRDSVNLKSLLVKHFDAPAAHALQCLFRLMNPPAQARDDIQNLAAALDPALCRQALELCDFATSALALDQELDLHIDLSELGSQGYHSGIVFQAYLADLDSPVASGGRYDRLLQRLGCPAPAVGFSIMLSKVAHRAKLGDLAGTPAVQLDAKQDFNRRFQDAVTLRQKGQRVAL